jgi:hypothetical protein
LAVAAYFGATIQRLIVLADFSSQKISQRKKSISVIFVSSSEAGESYQNSLPFLQSKAVTISVAEGLRC